MPNLTSEARELAESLKALADPVRIALASALRDGPMRVTDLAERLDISQSAASNALRRLGTSGLVGREPRGQRSRYCLDRQAVRRLAGRVGELARRPARGGSDGTH